MKNVEEFYQELKNNFPKIDQLDLWNKYDWSIKGYDTSFIMTDLGQEISKWDLKLEYDEISRVFKIIEDGFVNYDERTSSFLATDFLVTIMEIKDKFLRDEIKKLMRSKTQSEYRNMLKFYNEA